MTTTQAELKQAYRLVTDDLYQNLLKMEPTQTLRLTNLGKFTKKQVQAKSGLDGQTYVYYRISFSPFSNLKNALNEKLENELN